MYKFYICRAPYSARQFDHRHAAQQKILSEQQKQIHEQQRLIKEMQYLQRQQMLQQQLVQDQLSDRSETKKSKYGFKYSCRLGIFHE